MDKITKKLAFIGVDISKDHIDCAVMKKNMSGLFKERKFENKLEGFESLEEWLAKSEIELKDSLFCMEHTGTYGLLFFAWLSQRDIDFCVEPGLRIKLSLGMTRGKNDKIDARRIADYAFTNINKLSLFSFPSEHILQIKQLLTYREQLVRIRTSLKNSIKSHLQYEQITKKDTVTKDISDQINQYNQRIKQIEKEITELIESDQQLIKNFKLATSVKGIGLVIAAFMLVTTNNFSSFENGRKYACYIGLAPFEHNSGTSIKGKTSTSHLANKTLKTLFSKGANAASKWDPEIKAYYIRKTAEGKDYKVIMNAIGCKLVNRVFATVKRQTPYVITYQQKVA
jgi:transposase